MLEHGGRRRAAAQRYGIPESAWLDLSTGINPQGYPVPAMPAEVWNRLPEDDDGLAEVAAEAYGATSELLPLAGSQPAIQTLPTLFSPRRVAVLQPSYAEHRHHWQRAGHVVSGFAAPDLEAVAAQADVIVLCNPNNPDGTVFPSARLLAVAAALAVRGGHLLVDEAFGDAWPEHSVIGAAGTTAPNLLVLRSLGKFYGLAGARVGFLAAAAPWRATLREVLGPWPVAGPARWAASAALADRAWQAATRDRLIVAATRLAGLLDGLGTAKNAKAEDLAAKPVVCPLFVWLPTDAATELADALARRAVLVRHFASAECSGVRFGLPADEPGWQRLAQALAGLSSGRRAGAARRRVLNEC